MKIYTKKGGSHSMNFGQNALDQWRGWYDHLQNMISIVIPPHLHFNQNGRKTNPTELDVPKPIIKLLLNTFKTNPLIKVF